MLKLVSSFALQFRYFISASFANMLPGRRLFSACFLAGLITSAAALPAGSGTGDSGTTGSGTTGAGNALPVDIPEGQSPGPPGYSGSVYGSPNFAGPDGNPVDTADSAIVSNYQLVPGQQENADLGLFLDLNEVQNPQPIRGSNGGTDPGPRKDATLRT